MQLTVPQESSNLQLTQARVALMPAAKSLDYLNCSIANALEVVGDRWNLLILRDAFLGARRFDDFRKDLGIARNILSDRLGRLTDAGILETRRYQDHPPRDEYRLTPKGNDLFDILLALWRWGDEWDPPAPGTMRELIHLDCGKVTHSVPSCAHCGKELTRGNLRIVPGLDVVEARLAATSAEG